MKKIARHHGFRCLLHEKPFAGINGSGKHNNWSLTTDTGILLHGAGKTADDNLRFVTFIVETLMGVFKHNGLLKASIMSATNAHRLGANEAPPAIISSFLGTQLTKVLDHLEKSTEDELIKLDGKQGMKLDIPQIPELMVDNTDRNRTSPFAFTGNRFEFRAVGSEANCASGMIALNTAVAEALADFKNVWMLSSRRVAPRSPPFWRCSVPTSRPASLSASMAMAILMNGRLKPRNVDWIAKQLSCHLRPVFGSCQCQDV